MSDKDDSSSSSGGYSDEENPDPSIEDIDNVDFSEEVPQTEKGLIKHLISQLRPGMSLERVTLPTFILETRSTIERLTDWMVNGLVLREANDEQDPFLRCLVFIRWLIAGFHLGPRTPKKPYNPLLGECYRNVMTDADGRPCATYEAEQCSHHPPVSAFYYCDRQGGNLIYGHTEIRSKFLLNSIAAIMDNPNTMVTWRNLKWGEDYEFNFPNMYGRGILIGRLMIEYCGKVRVHCPQTGVYALVKMKEKPTLRGKYNEFRGEIYEKQTNGKKEKDVVRYKFSGRWSAYMKVTRVSDGHTWIAFDVRKSVPMKIVVPPLDQQSEAESKFIWSKVTEHLVAGDVKGATEHKLQLEDRQRAMVKYCKDENVEWVPQRFHWDEEKKRYLPNDLNLAPVREDEPVQEMPEGFVVPELATRMQDAGVCMSVHQVHENAERVIQEQAEKQETKSKEKEKGKKKSKKDK